MLPIIMLVFVIYAHFSKTKNAEIMLLLFTLNLVKKYLNNYATGK